MPSDSFGGLSPERKASEMLKTFFTFAAVKIVLAQMEGLGRQDVRAYGGEDYSTVLSAFIQEYPLKGNNSDAWLAKLMEQNELLGVITYGFVRQHRCTFSLS